MQCVKEEGKERCWFTVTEDGLPAKQQRKAYTECFYAMAMAKLHRATGELKYQVRTKLGAPTMTVTLPVSMHHVLNVFCWKQSAFSFKFT